jgi:hypothetical protein
MIWYNRRSRTDIDDIDADEAAVPLGCNDGAPTGKKSK